MEKAVTEAAPRLIDTYGVAVGILVMVLIVAVGALWLERRNSIKELAVLNKQFAELAERAVKGLEGSKGGLENSTRAVEEQGRTNDARQAQMAMLTASCSALKEAVERFLNWAQSRA